MPCGRTPARTRMGGRRDEEITLRFAGSGSPPALPPALALAAAVIVGLQRASVAQAEAEISLDAAVSFHGWTSDMNELARAAFILAGSGAAIHLTYVQVIRPKAEAAIEAARIAGVSAPREWAVILKDWEQEICLVLPGLLHHPDS